MRPVTQGDVIRAEAKDIPRIFQVIQTILQCQCYLISIILDFVRWRGRITEARGQRWR